MVLEELPAQASWRHVGVREGFEVAFSSVVATGHLLRGCSTAVEGGSAWSVGYAIETDRRWRTTRARVEGLDRTGTRSVLLERHDDGSWHVDGAPRADLAGCVDVDLESSAVTNCLPVRRLDLPVGRTVEVPAAFVRAAGLRVERLEQTYTRTDEEGHVAYASATFGFACDLTYDRSGLVISYPGIAERAG